MFYPEVWQETFKKPLTKNIVEAKILHTSSGLTLPIKRFSRSQAKQTLEFAGLHGYNENSKLLRVLLMSLKDKLQNEDIARVDIAIDFLGKIPNKVIKKLCEDRKPFRYFNTTYYKSKSEKKQNNRLNIKTYNKSLTKNETKNIQRLEFSFLSSYIQKTKLKDIRKLYKKMEKTIKRFSGLNVQIQFL
ncbi:hypothetical protein FJR45_00335 [Sulfurimonas sediminis]|uniref:Uncharacterized protein n=1 Tax=Sulfurimonas sediminis TaxID=2590020 RepID=A0A7M1AYF0_9BACT|nr:hypothetical protein [Sulfurimonas sediminis]QOP42483.1 hypothetical protein FJR45_00335 [Sulfurimonas sediminis]